MSHKTNIPIASSSEINANSKYVEDTGRVKTFKNASTLVVERYFSSIKFPQLKEVYPEINTKKPTEVQELQNQLLLQLKSSFLESVEEIVSESNILSSLLSLDNITTKNDEDPKNVAWRPSGSPQEDIRDHIYQLKLNHKKSLEFELRMLTTENDCIEQIVNNNHEEILKIKSDIDGIKQQVNDHLNVPNDQTMDELERKMATVNLKNT